MCTGQLGINHPSTNKSSNESEYRKNLRAEIMVLRNKKIQNIPAVNKSEPAEMYRASSS